MRLKTELHAIIGVCAGATFLLIAAIGFSQVRRFHRVEYVEARGEAMGRVLGLASSKALQGPSPRAELEQLLGGLVDAHPADAKGLDVVSAVLYDREGRVAAGPLGGTSREHSLTDDHVKRAFASIERGGAVEIEAEPGETFGRFGTGGEEIVEFAVPLLDDEGGGLGVLVFSLARRGARTAFLRTVTLMVAGAALVLAFLWLALFKLLQNRILSPILLLNEGIKRVRAGDLSARVEIYRRDELGTLVESFNDLIAILVERDSLQARLEEANRLAEAHERLNDAHRQLKEAQEQLILTEKHASIGRLVHGLNHELNNPLSAAQNMIPPLAAALENLRAALVPPAAPAPSVVVPVAPAVPAFAAQAASKGSGSSSSSRRAKTATGRSPSLTIGEGEGGGREAGGKDETQPADITAAEGGGSEAEAAAAGDGALGEAGPSGEVEVEATGAAPGESALDLKAVTEDLEDATQAVEVLARSVTRAINIVRDLGEFSRLTTADLETVELKAVIEEALAACEHELGPEGRIAVSVEVPDVEGAPLRLKAFPHLLGQVFVNLITNSAQAMEGPGKLRIWARRVGDDRVRIELDDNGPGIPKDHLSKVFEPFFTTKEPGKGTGLGLSICLGVVQKHGGTIECRKRWRGAHFVIELPLEANVEAGDPKGSTSILSSGRVTTVRP